MSEAALEKIADAAMQKGSLEAVRIIHRVGRLLPEDNIVFVGCASAHRHAAFDGCRYIMDF
jgi:molybdopterin synthase catalytic subunit